MKLELGPLEGTSWTILEIYKELPPADTARRARARCVCGVEQSKRAAAFTSPGSAKQCNDCRLQGVRAKRVLPVPPDKEILPLGPLANTKWSVLEIFRESGGGHKKDAWCARIQCSCGSVRVYPRSQLTRIDRPLQCNDCRVKDRKKTRGFTTMKERDGARAKWGEPEVGPK